MFGITIHRLFLLGFLFLHCTAFTVSVQGLKLAALKARAQHLMHIVAQDQKALLPLKKVDLEIVDPLWARAPDEIRKKGCMGVCYNNWKKRNHPAHIFISSTLDEEIPSRQSRIILHELAHAYDTALKKAASAYCFKDQSLVDGFYPDYDPCMHYAHLRDDIQEYLKDHASMAEKILAHEWHADWQAIQWMKKYLPDEVTQLLHLKKDLISRGYERIPSGPYPSLKMLVKWMEEKDPRD